MRATRLTIFIVPNRRSTVKRSRDPVERCRFGNGGWRDPAHCLPPEAPRTFLDRHGIDEGAARPARRQDAATALARPLRCRRHGAAANMPGAL